MPEVADRTLASEYHKELAQTLIKESYERRVRWLKVLMQDGKMPGTFEGTPEEKHTDAFAWIEFGLTLTQNTPPEQLAQIPQWPRWQKAILEARKYLENGHAKQTP